MEAREGAGALEVAKGLTAGGKEAATIDFP